MATTRTKFTVGLFLIVGAVIGVAVIIWVGMTGYFEKGLQYALYFDESVQGLGQDSMVKYRGVPVGRVEQIRVAPDGELVEVIVKIEKELEDIGSLTGKMKAVGITGVMFIELDQRSLGSPAKKLNLSFEPHHPVIPTEPSDLRQIIDEVYNILERLRSVNWEGMMGGIQDTVDSIRKMVSDTDTRGISQRVTKTFDSVNRILADLERVMPEVNQAVSEGRDAMVRMDDTMRGVQEIVSGNRDGLEQAIASLDDSMAHLNKAMDEAGHVAEQSGVLVSNADARLAELYSHLLVTSRNLEKASDNLNQLFENVLDDPGQLIMGKPPEPRLADRPPE
ncbi:MAG: MlaD family protein [Desulfatibacillaceae bacterium]